MNLRHRFCLFHALSLLGGLLLLASVASAQQPFAHPGIVHSRAALDRMRDKTSAGEEPWASGLAQLKAHPFASARYRLQGPFDSVSREQALHLHAAAIEHDANAAYYNALLWAVTGEPAHAEKAVEILNAWSGRLKAIVGKDAQLLIPFATTPEVMDGNFAPIAHKFSNMNKIPVKLTNDALFCYPIYQSTNLSIKYINK